MQLLDLVTPWATAHTAPAARRSFHAQHHALLDRIRRQRAPLADELPLATDAPLLDRTVAFAADASLLDAIRDAVHRAVALGADPGPTVLLIAGDGSGDGAFALPGEPPLLVLSLECFGDPTPLLLAMARAHAHLTRWIAPESASRLRAVTASPWDVWESARSVPLGEWIYSAGIGVHLAQSLFPELAPHRWLGLRRGEFERLRERERTLRDLLQRDLDDRGLGLLLRWLVADTPPSARRVGETIIPPGAGRYLGWRMTAERVTRIGLAAAIRAEA